MKHSKQPVRIGELAEQLAVERFVIRFWEKEFDVYANRSDGGQRYYCPQDVEKFKRIKQLLYENGFTIAGAKKILMEQSTQSSQLNSSEKICQSCERFSHLKQLLIEVRKQLLIVRTTLQ